MRKLFLIPVLAIVVAVGCNRSEKGGGTAAGGSTFTLSAPVTATTIKQGESRLIRVDVKRDRDFVENIALTADVPAGSGLKAELVQATADRNTTYVDLRVTAAPNAVLGKHNVRVVGTPSRGSATEVTATVDVEAPPSQR